MLLKYVDMYNKNETNSYLKTTGGNELNKKYPKSFHYICLCSQSTA